MESDAVRQFSRWLKTWKALRKVNSIAFGRELAHDREDGRADKRQFAFRRASHECDHSIRYNRSREHFRGTVLDIGQAFIRLPYSFDADQLADEVDGIADSAWMEHPTRMNGISAVALISRGGEDNDDFGGRMLETPHLQACPYMRQVLASFGEVLGRSRLMKLDAGAEVALHVDFNYHWYSRTRIHIPIITNPQVTFFCADQSTNMLAGESWIFNAWRRHRVTNASDQDRVHLVVDIAGSSRFWSVVAAAAKSEQTEAKIAYESGKSVDIRTEKYNTAAVMAPGEVDALVADLISDFASNTQNDLAMVNRYRSLLFNFSKDWRETYLQYGQEEAGRDYYQAAIDAAYSRLSDDKRALLTGSNSIGVNPVIVQRILRAVLAD